LLQCIQYLKLHNTTIIIDIYKNAHIFYSNQSLQIRHEYKNRRNIFGKYNKYFVRRRLYADIMVLIDEHKYQIQSLEDTH